MYLFISVFIILGRAYLFSLFCIILTDYIWIVIISSIISPPLFTINFYILLNLIPLCGVEAVYRFRVPSDLSDTGKEKFLLSL